MLSTQSSSNTSQPLVSVVIPTWNAAEYLPATLDTVFGQTWPNIQVVVVDDGSTDNTTELLAGYGSRITVVSLKNSGGPSRPRNQGIEHSQGEFIAFFDSDDLMEPEKISRAISVFTEHPDVSLVCSNFRSIDPTGKILEKNYLKEYLDFRNEALPAQRPNTMILAGEDAFSHLLRSNFIGTSSVVCRKDILLKVGPFAEEMKNADDIDMWLRIVRNGCAMAFIDEILHSYRITPGGVTARGAGRIPAMIKGLANQQSYCRNEADREFIQKKIRALHLDRAWELRQIGDLSGAADSYKAGLAMGWSLRPFVGLVKTKLLTIKKGTD